MSETKRPVNIHEAYHAHVYFGDSTKAIARKLYEQISQTFNLQVGTFIKKPIGPHPCWSYQIIFEQKDFDNFIPWLDENREDLTVLVHGLTGDNYKDHTDFAYWLGKEEILNLAMFK